MNLPERADAAQIAWIAFAQVAGMTVWFSATAVLPALRPAWGLDDAGAAWVTGAVQVGFAVGALLSGVLQLADRFDARHVFAAGAFGAAACTFALTFVDEPALALVLRGSTGFLLAAVYPPGMKLAASHAPSSARGTAIGILVGALTLGSAAPHLVRELAAGALGAQADLPWRAVLRVAAGASVVAGLVVLTRVRVGPFVAPRAPFAWSRMRQVVADRTLRRLNAAYCGHMWELYAFWTWLGAWLGTVRRRPDGPWPSDGVVVFGTIGIAGALGAVAAGPLADRFGRRLVARTAMFASATCCVLSPFVPAADAVLLPFLALWGAVVIADSAQLSAASSEACAPGAVGTVLTLQTFVGFSLTLVSIRLVPVVADWWGWPSALWILGLGPLLGAASWRRST
jgi:MFS family permease